MSGKGSIVKSALESPGLILTNKGALATFSGEHTGRCPGAKYIVKDNNTEHSVDWEKNQAMSTEDWDSLCKDAESFLRSHVHYGKEFPIVTAAAGKVTKWENRTRKIFKFICEDSVQQLFVENMFEKDLVGGERQIECEVYCLPSLKKEPTVAINFSERKIIICGTRYLGEIKKSVFTYMNYILTDVGVLPMHCSVNVDHNFENPSVFFGLSGTGKTTLSSSKDRTLLGDDEHGWFPGVLFNIESGCYAKTIDLSLESEPEIYSAANKFGSIMENVSVHHGEPDFFDDSITRNGRVSYPISHLENYVESGCVFKDPNNIVMLTCDAFGVLPAISKLTIDQARDMFLVGYTSKVAGTEVGVSEPVATFSSCFGAPFLPRRPEVYADILEGLLRKTGADCWLVNTGWESGPYGVGKRMDLDKTRSIIESIVDGTMAKQSYFRHSHTGFMIPRIVPALTSFNTRPESSWESSTDYRRTAKDLMTRIKKERRKFK